MNRTVTIKQDTWKELWKIKMEIEAPSIDAVINYLIMEVEDEKGTRS